MADAPELIVDTLRGRVLRGLHAGALAPGDRLPTSRELAAEFDVEYRIVISAYKVLAAEGLIELRPRGGVYVAAGGLTRNGIPPLSEEWLVDFFTQGLAREIPGPDLHEWLRRSTETLRLRAAVIASTADQSYGLCRELRDDFGLDSVPLLADEVRSSADGGLALQRADLVVTTRAHAGWVGEAAAAVGKAVVVIDVRPELRGGEWALLLRRPVYAVVSTPAFGEMLQRFYASVPGIDNLHVFVLGREDLEQIPEGAPTYVTQHVRAQLNEVRIPGRLLPAARTISTESARALFAFIVRSNIEAMSRLPR